MGLIPEKPTFLDNRILTGKPDLLFALSAMKFHVTCIVPWNFKL